MVLRSASDKAVPFPHQVFSKRNGVRLNLLRVGLKPGRRGLLQRHGESTDLVVVGPTLQRREHRKVDLVLEIINRVLRLPLLRRLRALPVKDHPRPWTPQALMRGGGHNVTILEGVVHFLYGHKVASVCHVAKKQCPTLIRNFLEAFVVPIARVSTATIDYQFGPKV